MEKTLLTKEVAKMPRLSEGYVQLKKIIKKWLPPKMRGFLIESFYIQKLKKNGLSIRKCDYSFDILDNTNRCVRISRKHYFYLQDIVNSFDYFFSAVIPLEINGLLLVDYSTPRFHEVVGYGLHPIMFSSFSEPIVTTQQYLNFAKLNHGSIVLDLGAYSGLTSIIFDQLVGNSGRVISVEADQLNIRCIKNNFYLYNKITGRKIELLEGAVWNNNDGITFSTEGNMGSSVVEYVGEFRGEILKVKTFTLSTIAKKYNLQKVDFIKCDIEGAESVIFNDSDFFNVFKPRIIIEPHIIGRSTIDACIAQLAQYGYKCKEIKQHGVTLPLLECCPNGE
jgi:FkbM family methyltransferase